MRLSFLPLIFLSMAAFAIEPPPVGLPRSSGFCCDISTFGSLGFISGYSGFHGQPVWVFHEVRAPIFKSKRSGHFSADKRLSVPISPSVFANSGFDRGHLAPSHDVGAVFGPLAQRQSFLMTNICPQRPVLNRKVWRKLESWCWSNFSKSTTTTVIFSGPIFDNNRSHLGQSPVELPDAFFKVVFSDSGGSFFMVAFIVPANASSTDIGLYVSTVDMVEEMTGFDFFPLIPVTLQNSLESKRPLTVPTRNPTASTVPARNLTPPR